MTPVDNSVLTRRTTGSGDPMPSGHLTIAMLSIHSSPLGVLGTRDTGGMSVVVSELAGELGRLGHRVDIFTARWSAAEPETRALAANVRLVGVDIGHHRMLSKNELYPYTGDYAAAIADFTRRQGLRYDLIHSHYWLSGHVGRMLQNRWKRPHVITFHTLAAVKTETGVGPAEPARRLTLERQLVVDSDGLLVLCEGEKNNLMHYYMAVASKIAIVPGGVDLTRFRPTSAQKARRWLKIDPDERLLLSVGRLSPQKGQERIIDALANLGGESNCKLVLVGGDGCDDPEQRRLQIMAAQAGLAGRVIFAGSVSHSDLPAYYSAANICVQASHYESFGLVGLEALACGCPVVSTPVGVMADLGRTGFPVMVVDGSSSSLTAGILAALTRSATWPVSAIRETVRGFSWTAAATAALEAYRRAWRHMKGRPVTCGARQAVADER